MKPKAAESRQLTPPFWAGCGLFAWLRLLARNHFAIDRCAGRWPRSVPPQVPFSSALGLIQNIVHGRDIANTRIRNAPVFVLGHWRSGTTLLHELLARDPRLAAPTTFDCFNPNHFVLTRNWLPGLFQALAPSRRPMDSMAAGWNDPRRMSLPFCSWVSLLPMNGLPFHVSPAPGRETGIWSAARVQDRKPGSELSLAVQALTLVKQRPAPGAEVASPFGANPDAAQALSRCPVHTSGSRSICRLLVHAPSLADAVRRPGSARIFLERIG